MKISPKSPRVATAFTLIELLVVILIIAILVSLLFPAFSAVREQGRKVSAHSDITQILGAIKNYQVEYQKFPVVTTGTMDSYFGPGPVPQGTSQPSPGTNDVIIDVLRYNTGNATNSAAIATLNPRGVPFLDVPSAHNPNQPVSGVVPNNATTSATAVIGAWYDAWGGQYNILLNTSYSNYLANPYASTDTNAPGGNTLGTTVLVYSYGRNGALGGGPVPSGSSAPAGSNFSNDSGQAGIYKGSDDIISWQ